MVTIGLVANIYNEAHALPGWLETHLPHFDDVRVYHSGPQGELSDDGTMDILYDWRVPFLIGSIDDGFGATRTRAIRSSPCDWVMLLDCDERFYPTLPHLKCSGTPTPHAEVDAILATYSDSPDWDKLATLGAGLKVEPWLDDGVYSHIGYLRQLLTHTVIDHYDAVATVRRHWHGLGHRRPTQNWMTDPDWQLRIVRNVESVYFDPGTRMHERLVGARGVYRADFQYGPFFDHFHFHFKRMEWEQRRHDVAVYDAVHAGRVPPTREEWRANND